MAAPCRTAKACGAFAVHSGGYHTIKALKLRTPDNVREDPGYLVNGFIEGKEVGDNCRIFLAYKKLQNLVM